MALLFILMSSGCAFGPRALEQTHGRYNQSVKEVEDEQLLLNVVRLRYNESAMRLDVSSIAAQYELSGAAEARPFFGTESVGVGSSAFFKDFSKILPFVSAGATTRPTFSMTPLDDPENIRQYFNPSTLDGIAFLAETSWPVSTVFRLYVDSMNRVPNARFATGPDTGLVPEFHEYRRVTQIMQELQDSCDLRFSREEKLTELGTALPENAVTAVNQVEAAKAGLEYQQNKDKTWRLIRRDRRLALLLNPRVLTQPNVIEMCKLLHLAPNQTRYEIVVAGSEDIFEPGGPPREHLSISITPRSTVQSIYYSSYGVIVPSSHYQCGLVKSTINRDGTPFDWQQVTDGILTVHTSCDRCRPKCAYAAVRYRDHWYYIDDRDAASKSTFTLLMTMSRLNLLVSKKGGPTLTLPVGR